MWFFQDLMYRVNILHNKQAYSKYLAYFMFMHNTPQPGLLQRELNMLCLHFGTRTKDLLEKLNPLVSSCHV